MFIVSASSMVKGNLLDARSMRCKWRVFDLSGESA